MKLGSIIFLSPFVEALEGNTRGSYTSLKGQRLNSERSGCPQATQPNPSFVA